jgi:hypothetical protein
MKTSCSARRLVRLRFAALCLAVAALAVFELKVGTSLASRAGRVTARSQMGQTPNVTIGDLLAAGH